MDLRIIDITTFVTRVGHRNQLLVRVRPQDGPAGWGESGYTGREHSVIGAIKHFEPWLIGRDARRRDAIYQEMYRAGFFEGGRSLGAAAAAIDIALYDLVGKALDVPVYELLGGAQRDSVRCFAHVPGPLSLETVQLVRTVADAGWPAARVQLDHVGHDRGEAVFDVHLAWAAAAQWLPQVRDAVGPALMIGLHGHHRLTPFEAIALGRKLPPGTIDYFEEPIRNENPEAYRSLRERLGIPLAVGAEFSSKWDFAPFLETGLIDLARIDVGLTGLTEGKKIAAIAETHYIDLLPHNPLGPIATAAAVHLAAAVPNHLYLEIRESPTEDLHFYDRRIFTWPLTPGPKGEIPLPTRPGLGVEVDEGQLTAEAPLYEEPHWRRPDGSWTNW